MSGWAELTRLDLTVRPLVNPPPIAGRWSQFRAPFTQTISMLAHELRELDAKRIVLQLGLRDRDIRVDGMPRADARLASAAVAISFESVYGPLRYATGEYRDWQDNLRAIALSMKALRAVDRYAVSKRGEQYQGWLALPASTDAADQIVTEGQAIDLLHTLAPGETDLGRAYKIAAGSTHPDRGGNSDDFRRVMRAKEILGL